MPSKTKQDKTVPPRMQAATEARLLTRESDFGVISTISHNLRGYPFGSMSPLMSDDQGYLYLYISDIAQHAKNLTRDNRLSITLFNTTTTDDQNTQGRVTVVGDAQKLDEASQALILEDYIRLFPDAEKYKLMHDFNIWRLTPVRVRYIGGFGKIFWIEPAEWLQAEAPWDSAGKLDMIEHMNTDHQDAMQLILQHQKGITTEKPTMPDILTDGCYIRAEERNYFIPFTTPCESAMDVRKALVELTNQARKHTA